MIPEAAQKFADACVAELGARVIAILLEGSFARGDDRDDSDIDLFVLVDTVDNHLLQQVGAIVSGIQTQHELNPAVVSITELQTHPELFEYLRVKHDGITLQGALPEIDTSTETELDIAKRTAQTVLMSSRHYLAVAEPAERFSGGKLRQWNLKPLGFALRLYHLAQTGEYIRSVRDLAIQYPVLSLDPVEDWQRVLQDCIVTCEKIIRTQREGGRPSSESAPGPSSDDASS